MKTTITISFDEGFLDALAAHCDEEACTAADVRAWADALIEAAAAEVLAEHAAEVDDE